MKMYMVCELDSEDFSRADIKFYEDYHGAQTDILDELKDNMIYSSCDVKFTRSNNGMRYDLVIENENSFYVTEVKEIEAEVGQYALVYHHAYDGVDFEVELVGTKTDCENMMHEQMNFLTTEMDVEIVDDHTIDTGNEWQVWDVVEIREVIER